MKKKNVRFSNMKIGVMINSMIRHLGGEVFCDFIGLNHVGIQEKGKDCLSVAFIWNKKCLNDYNAMMIEVSYEMEDKYCVKFGRIDIDSCMTTAVEDDVAVISPAALFPLFNIKTGLRKPGYPEWKLVEIKDEKGDVVKCEFVPVKDA